MRARVAIIAQPADDKADLMAWPCSVMEWNGRQDAANRIGIRWPPPEAADIGFDRTASTSAATPDRSIGTSTMHEVNPPRQVSRDRGEGSRDRSFPFARAMAQGSISHDATALLAFTVTRITYGTVLLTQ